MAAIRSGLIPGYLTRCFVLQTGKPGPSSCLLPDTLSHRLLQRSFLHTVLGSSSPAGRAALGRRQHGVSVSVKAVAVRHNSSQIPIEAVSMAVPVADSAAPPPFLGSSSELTTADPALVITQPIIEQLAEAPPTAVEALQAAVMEPTLAELGLACNTPVGLVQKLLESMHVDFGVPWWGAIAIGTVMVRLFAFPVIVKAQRESVKMNNVMPEMSDYAQRISDAKSSGNKFEFAKAQSDYKLFMKKKDINPFRAFLIPMVQAPVFLSFFLALRKMAELPVPSLQTGGMLWFPDLTVADPYHILPVVTTVTVFFVIELGAESGVNNPNLRTLKNVFRAMPFLILPVTINFPTAVFTYWVTSNCFSLAQVALLKHPLVRKKLKIPKKIKHILITGPQDEGLIKSMKTGWQNAQLAHQLEEREKRIKNHLDLAARGPVRQTFTHNPLQQAAPPIAAASTKNQPDGSKPRPWKDTIG